MFIQNFHDVMVRIKAIDDLLEMESARARGEVISEAKITGFYIKILGAKFIEAVNSLPSKNVAQILSATARVELNVAQKAITRLKARIKASK